MKTPVLVNCLPSYCSLIKMVSAFSKKSRLEPTWPEMVHAIKRNFGGLDLIDPVKIFETNMQNMETQSAVCLP